MDSEQTQPYAGPLRVVADGPWQGWFRWSDEEPFEGITGPFHLRRDESGIVCGFRPQQQHLNGHGIVHGGALMTFADYALFAIASGEGQAIHGVTVTMNCEFVSGAPVGGLLLARGEIVRAGRSLVFARGTISSEDEAVLAFSGTIKRLKSA